jgi:hypothetical protein
VTSSDRETAFVFGLLLLGAGAAGVWLCVKQFREPVRFTDALAKRLGGDRSAKWLRAIPAAYPGPVRANAAIIGIVAVLFCALGGWMLLSAFAR